MGRDFAVIKNYFDSLKSSIDRIDHKAIQKAIDLICEVKQKGGIVYIMGNGGSAATSEHFANDLYKMAGVTAVSLTQFPLASAYANDIDYSQIFTRQLSFAKPEELAVGISCSGRSANVVKALRFASLRGLATLALTGDDSKTPLAQYSDLIIHASSDDIRKQEDIHLAICHVIAGGVKSREE